MRCVITRFTNVHSGPIFSRGIPRVSLCTAENSTDISPISGSEKCSSPPTKQKVLSTVRARFVAGERGVAVATAVAGHDRAGGVVYLAALVHAVVGLPRGARGQGRR